MFFKRPKIINDDTARNVQDSIRETLAGLEQEFNAIATALLGTEEFAKTASVLANFRVQLGQVTQEHMSRQLGRLNMPSRDDIAALGARMTEIDDRLIRIEDRLKLMNPKKPSPARKRPPRTKRPAKPKSAQPK